MKNLNPWEVFSLICYLLVFSFLQSLAVLAGLLGLSLILPGNILKENFVVRGNIIAVCVLLSMMLHLKLYTDGIRITLVQSLARWWTVTFLFTLMLAWLLSKLRTVEKAIQEFADRATIFLYIFLPVTVLGGVVVIVRLFLAVI